MTTKTLHVGEIETTKAVRVYGFKRDDHDVRVNVILDDVPTGLGAQFEIAESIGGPAYCFHASDGMLIAIPDEVKNRLLTNDELYAAAPELNPQRRARRTAR